MTMPDLRHARILIVDDEPANVLLLLRLLAQAGYTGMVTASSGSQVLPLYREHDPDLVLLDLHMPGMDGFGVLDALSAEVPPGSYLPVLVLTADITQQAKERALAGGASDFLTKPFDNAEALLRIRNLLRTRFLHRRYAEENGVLEARVRERTQQLESAHAELLERLAQAAEFRDDDTGQHTQRVGELSARLAAALGYPPAEVELIRKAAPLHDVGKIGVPDQILLKPGRLTAEEMEVMRQHTVIGAKLLSGGASALMYLAEQIAHSHHERWDGAGYPDGLVGEAIPLPARIVAVADFFDALSSDRPYRKAWAPADVLAEIRAQCGRHFDPRVVAAFLALPEVAAPGAPWAAEERESLTTV